MKTVYIIVRRSEDGFVKLDTSGLHAYSTYKVAEDDLKRFLFPGGYTIIPLPIVDEPTLVGLSAREQRTQGI